jgi:hypothetical protein
MKHLGILFLAAFFCLLVILSFAFDGTGGEGDSVHHFLYARYAFDYPELFFKHWAKPIWVMLMAPIAQFGFTAVKIAGAACTVGALYFGLLIARRIGLKPDVFAVVTAISMPFVIQLSLSGLTEPLFALWLMLGIWLYVQERDLAATAWISFLPLVRSEGLIIFCVIVIFLAIRRKWLAFLLLPLGHLIVGILGYPVHKNITWVIEQIPYTQMDGAAGYGIGKWSHFPMHMHEIIGVLNTWLLAAGMLYGLYRLIMYWFGNKRFQMHEMWLVYGMFTAYFLAHMIFWALGIFNSAGLLRVFIGVVPLMCLIIGRLLELCWNLSDKLWLKLSWVLLFLGLSIKSQPDLHQYKYSLQLHVTQAVFKDYVEAHPECRNRTIFTEFVDAAYLMDMDFFNKNLFRTTTRLTTGSNIPSDALIIWHNRWSITEAHMPLETLLKHQELVLIDSIAEWGKPAFYIFEKKDKTLKIDPSILIFKTWVRDSSACTFLLSDGVRARLLDKNCQYSDGVNLLVQEMPERAAAITVSVKMQVQQQNLPPDTHLVMSYQDKHDKTLQYVSQPVPLDLAQAGWQQISLRSELNASMPRDVVLKCYLWNAGANQILLDSLEIRAEIQ